MPKATVRSLLAVAAVVIVAGCSREQPAKPASHPEMPPADMSAEPHPAPSASQPTVDVSGIARAEGGKTIAEVFAEKDQLAGTTVVLRGKVVKVNANIMGRNWLHVRDGSGAEGTNDLTVTSTNVLPSVGDIVVVRGPVGLNKDLGMGYQYDVIIEDAEVTIEGSGT